MILRKNIIADNGQRVVSSSLLLLRLISLLRPVTKQTMMTKTMMRFLFLIIACLVVDAQAQTCDASKNDDSCGPSPSIIYQLPTKKSSAFPINFLVYLETRGILERMDHYHDNNTSSNTAQEEEESSFRIEGKHGVILVAPNTDSMDMRQSLDHLDALLLQFRAKMGLAHYYLTTSNVTVVSWDNTVTNHASALQDMILFEHDAPYRLILPIQIDMNVKIIQLKKMTTDKAAPVAITLDAQHSYIMSPSSDMRFLLQPTTQDTNALVSIAVDTSINAPEPTVPLDVK